MKISNLNIHGLLRILKSVVGLSEGSLALFLPPAGRSPPYAYATVKTASANVRAAAALSLSSGRRKC